MKAFQVDFFVVGAARCGTTSLYNYLNQHPQIYLPNIKELNYFSNVESKDYSVYKKPNKNEHYHTKIIKSYDIYKGLFESANDNQVKGDISPSYFWDIQTAQRIFEHNPNAKIIISLRNPVYRAFSHYVMNFGIGHEKHNSFDKALKAKRKPIWGGGNLYLELSSYYDPVISYYKLFKKENIHLLIFEDWTENKDNTLFEIFDFLDVNDQFMVNHSVKHNEKVAYKNIKTLNLLRTRFIKSFLELFVSTRTKDHLKGKLFNKNDFNIKLDPDLKIKLKEYFKNDVQQLQEFLGISLMRKWDLE